jgi:1-acyl-sn-glycerol-3-phosphate acyltransferase
MAQRSALRRVTYWLTCVVVRLFGIVCFGLRTAGNENYPAAGGALVCSNHQSYFDPLLIGVCCPRRMNYLARETLFRGALGWLIRWYDAIPLQREGLGIAGIKESLRRLKRGEMLLIFPEGTRTATGHLQPLEPGFVALARRAKVPIVPVAIEGAYQAWPRSQRWPQPVPIQIVIGKHVSIEEVARLDDAALVDEIQRRISDCCQAARELRTAAIPHFSP